MEWQPIDSAPKDGTVVDLWAVNSSGQGERKANCAWHSEWWDDQAWRQAYAEAPGSDFDLVGWTPTHWMPLPEPPFGKRGIRPS